MNVPQKTAPGNQKDASLTKYGKKQWLLETVIYKGLIENYLMNHCLIVEVVLNILFSGANTLDLEHYMKPSLNNNRPDAVVIHIGSTDIDFRI